MKRSSQSHPLRTRFAKEIVCEFMPPERKSNKVAILCAGAPSYPGKRTDMLHYFAERGYWAFLPRYRGTWESDGVFLAKSPHLDVLAVMDGIEKGFLEFRTNETYKIPKAQFYLIGGSFGGPAVILASMDARVKKAVAISPVIDWGAQEGTDESLEFMERIVPLTFGNGYRGKKPVWTKLGTSDFYSPVHFAKKIDGKKVLIIHARDDTTVSCKPSADFARTTGATYIEARVGGHMGFAAITEPRFRKRVDAFLKR